MRLKKSTRGTIRRLADGRKTNYKGMLSAVGTTLKVCKIEPETIG
jgi:hypothetical protein